MAEALDLLGVKFPMGKTSFYIECPFCASAHKGRRKTMNINLNKGEGGVFSCLRCNNQGHVVNFWREMKGFSSNTEAAKDIQKTLNNTDAKPINIKKVKREVVEEEFAPIEIRDFTYKTLLESLTLSSVHEAELMKRGLSREYIAKKQYKSVPQLSLKDLASTLLDKGAILKGVPGFYRSNGVWSLAHNSSGIMIPQRDGFGRIQGFQLRKDNTKNGKYVNLTSNNFPEGTATKAFVHMAYNIHNDVSEIILTEGALKADVVAYLSGKSTLSVPGVNSTRFLPQALHDLKRNGLKKICIAFDMDMYANENVYKAFCRLKNLLREADVSFSKYEWPMQYKGFDDYLKERIYGK